MRNEQRGFNLIELLICLTLSVLTLTAVVPGMMQFTQRQAIVAEHNRLNAAMHGARTLALTRRGQAVVCPSNDASQCRSGTRWDEGWIVFSDTNGNLRRDVDEALWRADGAAAHGLRIRSSTGRPRAVFRRNGMARGSNLTLRLCDRDGTVRSALIINNGGRTRRAEARELRALARCE